MSFNSGINSLLDRPATRGLVTTSEANSITTTSGVQLAVQAMLEHVGTYAGSAKNGKTVLILEPAPAEEHEPSRDAALDGIDCDLVLLSRPLSDKERAADLLAQAGVSRHAFEVLRPVSLSEGCLQLEPTGETVIWTRSY